MIQKPKIVVEALGITYHYNHTIKEHVKGNFLVWL
jgi:hypothetical protein